MPLSAAARKTKSLKAEPRLADRLRGAVELARGVVPSAHDGPHRAVRRHGHQGRLGGIGRIGEMVRDGLRGDALELRVEGCRDPQVAVHETPAVMDLVKDPVAEIPPLVGFRLCADPRGLGPFGPFRIDEARLGHGPQHRAGALGCPIRVVPRRKPARRLQQSRQHRRLPEVGLGRGLPEIPPRGGVDPVGPRPEIRPVEVERKDLILPVPPFQPEREHAFADLASDRPFRGEEQVLGQLLGDRTPALPDAALHEVHPEGAQDTEDVHAGVLVEAPVLDRQHRLGHVLRKRPHPDAFAVEVAGGDHRPVVGAEQDDAGSPAGIGGLVDVGERVCEIRDHADERDHAPDGGEDAPGEDAAPEGFPRRPPAGSARTGSGRFAGRRRLRPSGRGPSRCPCGRGRRLPSGFGGRRLPGRFAVGGRGFGRPFRCGRARSRGRGGFPGRPRHGRTGAAAPGSRGGAPARARPALSPVLALSGPLGHAGP